MDSIVLYILFAPIVLLGVDAQEYILRTDWNYIYGTDYNDHNEKNFVSSELPTLKFTLKARPLLNNDEFSDLCCDIEDITTEYEDVTSTTGELRTTEFPQCPNGKSLISMEDLQRMIAFIVNRTQIQEQIYDHYHSTAEAIVEKHTKKLNNFLDWYTDRPIHLKHILEHIDQIHTEIQRKADKLSLAISDFEKQEEYYNLTDKKFKSVKEQFNKSKQYCEFICGDSEKWQNFKLLSQSPEYENKEYYCASLETVYRKTKDSMMEFGNSTMDTIMLQIQDDDLHYGNKITEFSNKLKNITLNKFGTNMYDILNLLDDYLHYNEIVEEISDANLDDIENQILKIDIEIPHLKRNINRLKELCSKKCSVKAKHVYVKLLSSTTEGLTINPTLETTSSPTFTLKDPKNVLGELLKEKQKDIIDEVQQDYHRMFEELNEIINMNDTEMMKYYVQNLQEIQNEIQGLTEDIVKKFNELKRATPVNQMEKIKTLARNLSALFKDVENTKIELNDMINKIHRDT